MNSSSRPLSRRVAKPMPARWSAAPRPMAAIVRSATSSGRPRSAAHNIRSPIGTVAIVRPSNTRTSRPAARMPCPDSPPANGLSESGTAIGTSVDWTTYPILTFSDAPEMEIVLLDRPDQPALGAGEPSTVTTAPAVANAVFDATGVRLRQMPFTPERVRGALLQRG